MKTWLAAILSLCLLASCDSGPSAKQKSDQFFQLAEECITLEKQALLAKRDYFDKGYILSEAKTPGEAEMASIKYKEAKEHNEAARAKSDAALKRLRTFENGDEKTKKAVAAWADKLEYSIDRVATEDLMKMELGPILARFQ